MKKIIQRLAQVMLDVIEHPLETLRIRQFPVCVHCLSFTIRAPSCRFHNANT
jgi:hypothetical protein